MVKAATQTRECESMKSTDNKKALNFGRSGLIVVNNMRKLTMTTLALSFNDVNFSPVQQNGQVWLKTSELAEALGYSDQSGVTRIYSRNEDEFTQAMSCSVKLTEKGQAREIRVFSLRGCHLIAMFSKTAIAKQFRKWVLDILDHEVLNQQIESRQSISPEQQALLHEIVARRSGGERKIFAEMWSRHNRHFKIPRYAELLAIHFPESVHFLETMQLKAKPEKQEIKALPYPQEVIQVAQQINNEYNGGHYHSWFISVRDDGVLSVQPLTKGYYPMNVVEFTKRFDGVLDYLYGSDLLRVGRYLANR